MTLPPDRIGDKGQHYKIRANGWPIKTKNTWSAGRQSLSGAEEIYKACLTIPGVTSVTIFDREENKNIITRFAGVLR